MLGPLFSAVEVARERLTSMLDAAKIRVCPVVYTSRKNQGRVTLLFLIEILEATRDSADASESAKDIAEVVPHQLTGIGGLTSSLPANVNRI